MPAQLGLPYSSPVTVSEETSHAGDVTIILLVDASRFNVNVLAGTMYPHRTHTALHQHYSRSEHRVIMLSIVAQFVVHTCKLSVRMGGCNYVLAMYMYRIVYVLLVHYVSGFRCLQSYYV